MPVYAHYSFDLWLTLIRSNASFKTERALYFFKKYNTKGKSLEEVSQVFRQVDLMCNAINEKTGGNIQAEEMYLMVISLLNDNAFPLQKVDTQELYAAMENLLFDYLPHVYCNQTADVLKKLKNDWNATLNILSNTGFIKGRTLRKVLKELELHSYFDFQLYSDETCLSKPNRQFFQELIRQIRELHKAKIDAQKIIHVGDNPVADIEGAKSIGINSHLINSNQQTILSLIQ